MPEVVPGQPAARPEAGWVATSVQRQATEPGEPVGPEVLRISRRDDGLQPRQTYRNDYF